MNRSRVSRLRALGAGLAALTTVGALAGPAAATAPEPPSPKSTSAFCTGVPSGDPFTDVDATNTHYDNIRCLVETGITKGQTSTSYNPTAGVTRAQMASFIARFVDLANAREQVALKNLPAYDGTPDFDDVPRTSTHFAAIMRLSQAGIVNGTGPRRYSPADIVNREQMAAFVNRAAQFLTGAKYTSTNDYFTDDERSTFEADINGIASRGIAIGDGRDAFGPDRLVPRDQMASFLVRALAVLHEDGKIRPLGGRATIRIDSTTIEQPGDVTGSITGTNVKSARVSGCGFSNEPVDDINSSTDGIQFREALPASQGPGKCTLTFTVVFSSGGDDVSTFEITVTAPDEAAAGHINGTGANSQGSGNQGAEVRSTNKGADSFVACDITTLAAERDTVNTSRCFTYRYDSGDTFRIGGNSSTLAAFEAELSPFDDVTGTYSRNGASTFNLINEAPAAPEGVTAAATSGAVTLTIDDSSTPSVDAYDIHRATASQVFGCQEQAVTFAKIGSTPDPSPSADSGNATYADTTTTTGTAYCYRVFSVDDGDVSGSSAAAGPVTSQGGTASGNPTSVAVQHTNGSNSGNGSTLIDTGDVIDLAFDRVMAEPGNGDAFRAQDTNTVAQITCGLTTATCVRNTSDKTVGSTTYAAGRVITVTLQDDPDFLSGTDDGLALPATITDQSGYVDAQDRPWNVTGSPAKTISSDTMAPRTTSVTQANGTGFALQLDSGDTITLDFNEAMRVPPAGASFSVEDGDGTTATITCSGTGAIGANASCARSSTDMSVLTVTMTSTPAGTGGTFPGVGIPATITGAANFRDLAGNQWDVAGSTDKTIN